MKLLLMLLTLNGQGYDDAPSSQSNIDTPIPPKAKEITHVESAHGEPLSDPFYWLREKTNPEVIDYLNRENNYTGEITASLEPLREKLYGEIISRIKQTDLSVPYKYGKHWYYTRTEEGKQYPIYCRKLGSLEGDEAVTLDLNELGALHKFVGLGLYAISDDGNILAYSLDTTGFRKYTIHFLNLKTRVEIPNTIGNITSGDWASDNKTFFYVKDDHAKRPYRLFRHRLGEENDELLYEETDELYRIGISRTSDREYILATISSSTTTEVRFLNTNQPDNRFQLLYKRELNHKYYVDHRKNTFFVRTNKEAKNFRLVTVPTSDPATKNWREFRPHNPSVKLEGITLFSDYIVMNEREDGLNKLRVHDFRTGKNTTIGFPEPVYSVFPTGNMEFNTTTFRYTYQSFVTPSSVFDYDMKTGKKELLKETEVPGGYDRSHYASERLYAKAADGTNIPISVVYKKGMKRDGSSPLLLYGYGSYGVSMPVGFNATRLSLLDRGVVYAIAHIRGGGDLGETWHDDGKMLKKKNTFTDFIDCADFLVKENFTSRDRLAIQGGSAGGLLIGAVLNMRPDLCTVAHLAVPFVDVINTMRDSTLPLTVGEFLEWGNPFVREEYDYMKSYCPYTNLETKPYPAMLITTSLNDSQVMYWEPAKYTAKMRKLRKDSSLLLLKTNMAAGHGGASGRYDAFKEQAFIFAFILHQLGVER